MTRATRTPRARLWPLVAIAGAFFAGVGTDAWLRTYGPPIPESVRVRTNGTGRTDGWDGTDGRDGSEGRKTAAASGVGRTVAPSRTVDSRIEEPKISATTGSIPHRGLRVPIDGANVDAWKGGFDERRGGGSRGHEAVDILSPRNTPIHAVASGTIAKIFESRAGGHTVYQFDGEGRLCYYYAHLERYADGLHEGQAIGQGDVIGFVGTSGNAPANTPHLHFAVFELGPEKQWWKGTPVDPYLVFARGSGG
jgi:peptidoglycan LD-endopeptidase LytH